MTDSSRNATNCPQCGGTHYGTGTCPFQCDRCTVNTGQCFQEACPRNGRWRAEQEAAERTGTIFTRSATSTTNAAPSGESTNRKPVANGEGPGAAAPDNGYYCDMSPVSSQSASALLVDEVNKAWAKKYGGEAAQDEAVLCRRVRMLVDALDCAETNFRVTNKAYCDLDAKLRAAHSASACSRCAELQQEIHRLRDKILTMPDFIARGEE